MALSKQRKEEVLAQYKEWLSQSQALILMDYKGASVKDMEEVRSKVRETGGEFHVVKNRLAKLALKENNYEIPEGYLENSTAIGFAFEDIASTAKALSSRLSLARTRMAKMLMHSNSKAVSWALKYSALRKLIPWQNFRLWLFYKPSYWAFCRLLPANWSVQLPNPLVVSQLLLKQNLKNPPLPKWTDSISHKYWKL